MSDSAGRRRAGLLIPLFASPSTASWGIGEIGDLPALARWLSGAGQRALQLLPINEMAPGQQSPYSAISAMAIDPIFIRVPDVPDFAALGGEETLASSDRDALASVRAASRVEYVTVRRLKHASLRAAFDRFMEIEWRRDTERARQLRAFVSEQAWWVEDYGVFRAIHASEGERAWSDWPPALAQRNHLSIRRARQELALEVLFFQYLQWLATLQWREARAQANARGVALIGDLPFMVDGDSADVWARQHEFRLDVSVGAPPDAFSTTGQDWGMPLYRWDTMAREDFRWLRERARRSADLYDGYRIDHLVGFFRTFGRERATGDAFFSPADEASQLALGERVLDVFRGAGAEVIAEDLGTVPDFVRDALARLGVPGFRVFRWEREWHADGQPFREPTTYPGASVATSGTHDTEPMRVWWERASEDERSKVAATPTVQRIAGGSAFAPGASADKRDLVQGDYDAVVRAVLLEALFASGSDLLLFPIQDVFGWRDRINEPATTAEGNWTYRLPWPIDRLDEIPEARQRQEELRTWSTRHGR